MIALGSLLVVIGFTVILPRDGLPGAASRTVVRQGMHVWRTAGSRAGSDEPDRPWSYAVARVVIGLAVLALGVWIAARGLDSNPAG